MVGLALPDRLKGEWIPMSTNALRTSPPRPAMPRHVIVARDHAGLCQALREIATPGNFTVIVDRRHAERRRRAQPVAADRRRGERRSFPAIATDPRRWPYLLVRQPPA
jgi:hypothetical protein